jgi:hypothetical protein
MMGKSQVSWNLQRVGWSNTSADNSDGLPRLFFQNLQPPKAASYQAGDKARRSRQTWHAQHCFAPALRRFPLTAPKVISIVRKRLIV